MDQRNWADRQTDTQFLQMGGEEREKGREIARKSKRARWGRKMKRGEKDEEEEGQHRGWLLFGRLGWAPPNQHVGVRQAGRGASGTAPVCQALLAPLTPSPGTIITALCWGNRHTCAAESPLHHMDTRALALVLFRADYYTPRGCQPASPSARSALGGKTEKNSIQSFPPVSFPPGC